MCRMFVGTRGGGGWQVPPLMGRVGKLNLLCNTGSTPVVLLDRSTAGKIHVEDPVPRDCYRCLF
jgi:hypothetical protein